jgi:hypothetical protein
MLSTTLEADFGGFIGQKPVRSHGIAGIYGNAGNLRLNQLVIPNSQGPCALRWRFGTNVPFSIAMTFPHMSVAALILRL